jgi:hypothetical protein
MGAQSCRRELCAEENKCGFDSHILFCLLTAYGKRFRYFIIKYFCKFEYGYIDSRT